MYPYKTFELFPTTAMKFDVSKKISDDDKSVMIQDIDEMERNNLHLQINELTPRLQSLPVLFHQDYPYVNKKSWATLQATFVECCYQYLHSVENFYKDPNDIQYTGSRAWFFKHNNDIGEKYKIPAHNHHPSFLSGVFYLHVPGDGRQGGTELCDPRGSAQRATRMVEILPSPLAWLIFPGWLDHVSGRTSTTDSRYVVAADCYVKVR